MSIRRFFKNCYLTESIILNEWKLANGSQNSAQNQPPASTTTINTQASSSVTTGENVVTIVYDNTKHKLRAQADDGVNGKGWVSFPTNLRTTQGQQYQVDQLVWNGKNYRVSGDIVPLTSSNKLQNNILENYNKENYNMNFISTFDELNKLYESSNGTSVARHKPATKSPIVSERLREADDEEIEIVDDESQLVLKCANCGALVIKAEADVKTEEAGLANTDEPCEYCEETKGYETIGTFISSVDETVSEDTEENTVDSVSDNNDDSVVEESACKTRELTEDADKNTFGVLFKDKHGGSALWADHVSEEEAKSIAAEYNKQAVYGTFEVTNHAGAKFGDN